MKRFLMCLMPVVLACTLICIGATVAFAASASDNLKVNFVDSNGNVIETSELAPGEELEIPDVNASLISPADGKVKLVEEWCINLGTELSANGFSYTDIATLGVSEITVYPRMSDESVIDTFAIYTNDKFGIPRLYGSLSDYENMSSLKDRLVKAPDSSIVTLLYDKDTPYEIGGHTSFSISAGKTLSFDLNGRTVVQSYGSTSGYGGYIFTVNEKSTFNLYSTAPGGAFYQARFNTNNQGDNVFAPGLIGIAGGVDAATVNVGDVYGVDGELLVDCADDFSLYGGTLVFATGSSNGEELNSSDGKIQVNVNGGFYYHSMRSGYAWFTIQTPDVYINVNDVFVYNRNTTYAIVHDYTNTEYSESHFTAKNSEFICRNADNTANTKFYYSMSKNSTAYFEDCVIMAQTAVSKKGVITLGGGNIVAGDMLEHAVLEDGVLLGKQNEAVLERTVTHPPLYNLLTSTPAPIIKGEDGKWAINPVVFDKSQWVYDAPKSCEIAAGTYKPDGAKSSVKEVKWLDRDGNQVGDSEYWVIGSKLVHREFEVISGNWYAIECSWSYQDGTPASDVTLTEHGESVFYAKPQKPIAHIDNKLASVTLSEHITFNLYLPVYSSVTVDSITADGGEIKTEKLTMDGKEMYRISWEMPYGSFAVNTVKLKYSVDNFGEFDASSASKSLECSINLDLLRYASIVAETSLCNSEESILIYEIVSYVRALAAFNPHFDESSVPNLEEFFLLYEDEQKHFASACECKATIAEEIIERADSASNYEELKKKGVKSMDYVFSADEIGIRVFVKNSSVKIESVTCTDASGRLVTLPFTFVASGDYYLISGVSARYIDNVVTINIGGVSGTYSLARFIFDFSSEYLKDYAERDIFKVASGLFECARLADLYNRK